MRVHRARALDLDRPSVPGTRARRADSSGKPRSLTRAVQEATLCVTEAESLWGRDDQRTLIMREAEMLWADRAGYSKRARTLAQLLVTDVTRVIPPENPLSYKIRHSAARVFETDQDSRRALGLYRQLMAELEQHELAGRPANPHALQIRRDFGNYLWDCGAFAEALEVLRRQLREVTRIFGATSVESLAIRYDLAVISAQAGNRPSATRQWQELWRSCQKNLPGGHSLTTKVLGALLSAAVAEEQTAEVVRWCDELLRARDHDSEIELRQSLERLRRRYRKREVC